jgi:hypothetical protein
MDIKDFLKSKFTHLDSTYLSEINDFSNYDVFRKFIYDHYQLNYLKKNNYIKYVKVNRQILIIQKKDKFLGLFKNIDYTINILASHQTFPRINIRKYMFKIENIFKIIKAKHQFILNILKYIKSLDQQSNFKISFSLNTLYYRYKIFKKYSTQLKNYLSEYINFEKEYDIDHKLIELNHLERTFIGKKSEYIANQVIEEYIQQINSKQSYERLQYFYETNINLIKLLPIPSSFKQVIKGEVDGMIISFNGFDYIIEYIIEVKSSIKATFEDTHKFISLQKYIVNIIFDENNVIKIIHDKYIFTKKSFVKIKEKHISDWVIYICINQTPNNFIEKSHLYFQYIFKIIDNAFIENFYCKKNDDSIKEKFNLINEKKEYIDSLFNQWLVDVNLYINSNIYINR